MDDAVATVRRSDIAHAIEQHLAECHYQLWGRQYMLDGYHRSPEAVKDTTDLMAEILGRVGVDVINDTGETLCLRGAQCVIDLAGNWCRTCERKVVP